MNAQQLFDRALSQHRAGDLAGAERLYRDVLESAPGHDRALFLLSAFELERGAPEAAVELLERALALTPGNVAYLANLGEAYRRARRFEQAAFVLEHTIALRPDLAPAHHNLGLTLERLDRLDLAVAAFQQALALDDALRPAHVALGRALWTLGRIDDALSHYRRAVERFPNDAELRHGLAVCLKDTAELDEAIEQSRRALELAPHDHVMHGALVYSLSFHPAYSDERILDEGRRWHARHAAPLLPANSDHDNGPSPSRCLRVGYVGPTFSDHIIGRLLEPVFAHRRRDHHAVVCYSDVAFPDARSRELQRLSDAFHDVTGLDDAALAAKIRADRIDILVDVNMHMASSRLRAFARRPAPVQACWIAYPGTTGSIAIDYRISDLYLDPPGTETHYAERTLHLPDSFWCYAAPTSAPAPLTPPPALGAGHVTFGCLNNFCKVSDGALELWAQVLRRVPRSRLLVLCPSERGRARVTSFMADHAIAAERLEFVGFQPRERYLATYQRIDIGLDTVPYNGHTTSLDAFWMGVPVVTVEGNTVAGRAGSCLAMNLGLPELVGRTRAEYVQAAFGLAGDLDRLRELRAGLRARMQSSRLMDAPRFTRNLEGLYRRMWREWCSSRRAG